MENVPLRSDPTKAVFFPAQDSFGPGPPAPEEPERLIRLGFEQDPQLGCELLYHRYYANLCSHTVRFVVSKEVAEDIVSEVFLDFWKNRIFEQITASYGAYLYRAVRNRAYNYLRHDLNRTRPLDQPDAEGWVDNDTPEQVLHLQEMAQRLDAEIQSLPPQSRRAFMLNRYDGKRYSEIAEELQISQKAVEHLISRALSRLRSQLAGDWLPLLLFALFH